MGWLQNLINKIKGNKQPLLVENTPHYNEVPNNMEQYNVDVSGMGNKSREEYDLEQAAKLAREGYLKDAISKQVQGITPVQLQAAINLGYTNISEADIAKIGGYKVVVDKMVEVAKEQAQSFGYLENAAPNYMPDTKIIVGQMIAEVNLENEKNQFRIQHPNRISTLNQLYNSALELARSGHTLNQTQLVEYASKRGGFSIDVNSKNPAVQEVDLQAAISLSYAVKNGYVDSNSLTEVGGPAKVLDEMSVRAKMDAKKAGYLDTAAKGYLRYPTEIIESMPKEANTIEQGRSF